MTVDYTQFDAEAPVGGYISPTWQRDDEESDVAEQLAYAFIAAVIVVKALDWSGLAQKWSERGYRDGDLEPTKRTFTQTFKEAARDLLVDAAGLGREQALVDFTAEFGRTDWREIAGTWSTVYANEMANQVADQSHKAVAELVPQLINRGMRGQPLAIQVRALYGLDPRSMNGVINFMGTEKKPRNQTVLDVAQKFLTRRANVIGDVQSFTGLNFGRQLTYLEAMDAGLLPPSARKVWVTAIDERVCKVCRPMDGKSVLLTDTFAIHTAAGTIRLLVPPVHPNCRCTVVPEERFRHGIITRRARFRDEGPSHRGRLRSEIEDLVSLGKSAEEVEKFSWEAVKHPRDKQGKFTDDFKHTAEAAAVTGLAAYTLLHPALRSRVTLAAMPNSPKAWAGVRSMSDFPGKIKMMTALSPEMAKGVVRLHSLDDLDHQGKAVLYHPKAYKHLEGKNLAETLQNVEQHIHNLSVEHSAVITPQGRILSMGRGTEHNAPVWIPTLTPKGSHGNLVFTHNHPDHGVGEETLHTLSAQDIIALHKGGIGRARAVTPRGGFYDVQTNPAATTAHLDVFATQAVEHALSGQDEAIMAMIQQQYGVNYKQAEELYGEAMLKVQAPHLFFREDDPRHDAISGMVAGYQARRMHDFYVSASDHPDKIINYTFGQHSFVGKAFSPIQLRDALGRFAPVAGAAAGAYVAASNFPKVHNPQPKLPRHLKRVDRKVRNSKNGTYLIPRQYLDFHQRGQSFRVGNAAHINDMAREYRQSGYKMKPITLHVYDDVVEVADGNHRVEAAYRAKLGFVPTKIVHIPGKKPVQRGVIPAWRQSRTNEARRVAASRYVGSLDETRRNPFRNLNQRLIAQDEKKHQWHDKSRKRTIKPL